MSDTEKTTVKDMSFEQALEELEEIVTALEAGEVPLDETLERFERAMLLKAHCQTLLEDAEARINKLLDEQGNTEPFAADADNDENEAGDADDAR
ncbi:MAG: exodeoxyribonuclease VII small subunit [Armatimonadetes bacterium]|nr:exodeoxyribonuclease VII small subunit [Armatimonadota bacterium]